MRQSEDTRAKRLIAMTENSTPISPDYLDEDLMIIDNVSILGLPDGTRPNMNIIAICTKGKLQAMLNGEVLEIHAHQVFICPLNTSLEELMVTPDFEYSALCITNRALQLYLRHFIHVWNEAVYVQKIRCFDLENRYMEFYKGVYELIKMCLDQSEGAMNEWYRDEVIKGLVSASLVGFCGLIQKQTTSTVEEPKRHITLFNRFLNLLQKTENKHQTVAYYASELCISSKYLTVICKKNSGKTANDWITEYTLSDISYSLRNTSLSIKEISNKLGFPNPSFFGKYVKDHFGCTPLEYKRKHQSKKS
ncbi:MAG: helix-turn-helix domain-containing protein [Prevotella sp.]